jgi:hypothetical protein
MKHGIHNNFFACIMILFMPFWLSAQKQNQDLERALVTIQPENIYSYCKTLSSARFSGRLTGQLGYRDAAKWAAERFREWKLRPLDEKYGYLQPYPSPYTVVEKAEMVMIIGKEKNDSPKDVSSQEFILGKDFLPCFFSDSGQNTAEVVFVGWGISAPDLGYDDYTGADVRGKFALCLRGAPDDRDRRFDDYNHLFHRVKNAIDKGALGLLIVAPEPLANPSSLWKEGFTHGIISEETADRILSENGATCVQLRKLLTACGKPLSFSLRARIKYTVISRHFPEGIGYNVAAYFEGSDPGLRKECLLIGAHLDHCGLHMGLLYSGADDNASGSSVVLGVAEAFSKLKRKPKRSVLFVLFGGEEMRIMGSEYFAGRGLPQFEKMDGMINLDMVGEGDGINCAYGANALNLKDAFERADVERNILRKIEPIEGASQVSDHLPFFRKGVMCIVLSSNGPHFGYHKSGDTIYRINPEIMTDCARLVLRGAYAWADR